METSKKLITDISEETGLNEDSIESKQPSTNTDKINVKPLESNLLHSCLSTVNEQPHVLSTKVLMEDRKEKGCVMGSEFHSLAVVALPLSSISAPNIKCISNHIQANTRGHCDTKRSNKCFNPCHTIINNSDQTVGISNNPEEITSSQNELKHSNEYYTKLTVPPPQKTRCDESKNTPAISCESMSLFDGVTVKIQYIVDENNSPSFEQKSMNIPSSNENHDVVMNNDGCNANIIVNSSPQNQDDKNMASSDTEKLISSQASNGKTNNNEQKISIVKADSNSTLSYLHDISLRKPTCDVTIPLRQPLSANYREQRTRGKCSPATSSHGTSFQSKLSLHVCKNVSQHINKQCNNNRHQHRKFSNWSGKLNDNNGVITNEGKQQRATVIKGCRNSDRKRYHM